MKKNLLKIMIPLLVLSLLLLFTCTISTDTEPSKDEKTVTENLSDIDLDHGPDKATKEGTNGNDHLHGTSHDDWIYGYGGDDGLWGEEGDDELDGGYGNDFLSGGPGNDILYGWYGNDELYGRSGNDKLYGSFDNNHLYGEGGNDVLQGGHGGTDILEGGSGRDLLGDTDGDKWFFGGTGNDWIRVGDSDYGKKYVYPGDGTDLVYIKTDSGTIDNYIYLQTGHDILLFDLWKNWGDNSVSTYNIYPQAASGTKEIILLAPYDGDKIKRYIEPNDSNNYTTVKVKINGKLIYNIVIYYYTSDERTHWISIKNDWNNFQYYFDTYACPDWDD